MPSLGEVAKKYSKDVGFLGLVHDFDSNQSGAVNIINSAGVPSSFVMVNAQAAAMKSLYDKVQTGFVPATIVMKQDGTYETIKAPYDKELDRILKEVG